MVVARCRTVDQVARTHSVEPMEEAVVVGWDASCCAPRPESSPWISHPLAVRARLACARSSRITTDHNDAFSNDAFDHLERELVAAERRHDVCAPDP